MANSGVRVALAAALAGGAACLAQPDATDPAGTVRYDGAHVVVVDCTAAGVADRLEAMGIDPFGCEVERGPTEFIARAETIAALRASGIPFVSLTDNLQAWIDDEATRIRAGRERPDGPWYADYKNLAAIEAYLDEIIALRPDLASRFSVGTSLEGRQMTAIRITNPAANPGRCKPMLFMHATQHAREWVAPMTAVYFVDQLVRQYDSNPAIRDVVDRTEIVLVPVANPDGYTYTWTTNRFWRKNRRLNSPGVFGVDLNRNWGHQWGLNNGSSGTPSSDTYRGSAPFSEPEAQRLRDFIRNTPNVRFYDDVHTHGLLLLHPWGYTPTPCPDHAAFQEHGQQMRNRIQAVHGTVFTFGIMYTTLYPVSGGAIDWVYADQGVFGFLPELRGGRFDPPASDIIISCEEMFPAFLYQAQHIAEAFPFRADWNGDCVHDIFDFLAFQNDFAAGDPRTDYNRDGSRDIFDFLDFQNDFVAER